MKNLSKREKVLINIALIALIGYFYYSLVLSSVIVEGKNSLIKTKGYKLSVKNENDKNEVIAKLKVDKESIKADYQNAIVALPSLEKNPEIINRLKTIAIKNGIQISSLSVEAPKVFATQGQGNSSTNNANEGNTGTKATGSLMQVTVQIQLEMSDYAKAKAFLTDLENEKRFAEMTSLNVKLEDGKIAQSISANFYYVDTNTDETPSYDFSSTPGGKSDIFK